MTKSLIMSENDLTSAKVGPQIAAFIFRLKIEQNQQNNLLSVCQRTARGASMQKHSTFQSYFHFSLATSFRAVTCEKYTEINIKQETKSAHQKSKKA